MRYQLGMTTQGAPGTIACNMAQYTTSLRGAEIEQICCHAPGREERTLHKGMGTSSQQEHEQQSDRKLASALWHLLVRLQLRAATTKEV